MRARGAMGRARDYLSRPDVSRDAWRMASRRLRYEGERRLAPQRLNRERRVRYDGDLHIWLRPSDVVDRDVYLYGSHEHVTATVFAGLARPNDVVVDAGAHIGCFTLLAAKRVGPGGRVLSFEPNPDQQSRLERNVDANGFQQVEVRAEALSDHPGQAMLHLSTDETRSGNATLDALDALDGGSGAVPVSLARLDDLVETLGVDRVDLMKLDVEGAEANIVDGAAATIERFRPAIVFEVNGLRETGDGVTAPAIEALSARGYTMYGMALTGDGVPALRAIEPGEDPRPHREQWHALNLLALHPASDRALAH